MDDTTGAEDFASHILDLVRRHNEEYLAILETIPEDFHPDVVEHVRVFAWGKKMKEDGGGL